MIDAGSAHPIPGKHKPKDCPPELDGAIDRLQLEGAWTDVSIHATQTQKSMKIRKSLPKGLMLRNGVYYYRGSVTGKRVAVSLQTRDLGEAIKLAMEKKQELLADRSAETLGRAIEAFLQNCEKETALRKPSIGHYRWGVNKLAEYFGARTKLSAITEEKLLKFFQELKKAGNVIPTQHSLRRVLRRFYKWAAEPKRRLIKGYPLAAIKLDKLGAKSRRSDPFCTAEQRDMLIKNAPDDDMRFILYMGFDEGCRKLEIVEARRRWFHIDVVERYMEIHQAEGIHLREGENSYLIEDSVERSIPITKEFKAFLQHYLRADLTPLDFVLKPDARHRKSQYRVDFTKPFNLFMHSQGMGWVTPHTMRRTFASLHVQEGTKMAKVAYWLGDDLVMVEKKYAFLQKSDEDIDNTRRTTEPIN